MMAHINMYTVSSNLTLLYECSYNHRHQRHIMVLMQWERLQREPVSESHVVRQVIGPGRKQVMQGRA